jgi:hypothetical protein
LSANTRTVSGGESRRNRSSAAVTDCSIPVRAGNRVNAPPVPMTFRLYATV